MDQTTFAKPILEPVAGQFLKNLEAQGGTPIYELSPEEARNVLLGAQNINVTKLPVDITEKSIPVGTRGNVKLRIMRPRGNQAKLPVVMYFHGGGWILGDAETHDRLTREIADGAQAAVVLVDYDRSPEAQYPAAIEQAYAATKYIAENDQSLNLDAAKLAVAGDSVGGNMVAAVTLLAKERGGPKICFQVLFYPVTDASMSTGSYKEFADGYWLSAKAMEWFWDAYLPDKNARRQPTVSPLSASQEQLKGLPPALLITDECDVLRDEGEAYARKLMEAGVKTTAIRCLGMVHDFVMLNALAEAPATRAAIELANLKLREAFA